MRSEVGFMSSLLFFLSLAAPMAFSQSGEWEKIEIARTKPPNRTFHAMTFDSRRGVIVLHGGISSSFSLYADTWEYDGKIWTRAAANGPGFYCHSMAYDANRGVTVLFGGRKDPGGQSFAEIWEWDGLAWKKVNASESPSPRVIPGLVYDPARKTIVCHGGSRNANHDTSYVVYSDAWEWNGQTWNQLQEGPPRWDHEMEFDNRKGKIVLFGGYESWGVSPTDTWEFDGSVWEQVAEEGPEGRCAHCMIFDPFRGAAVLFGGFMAEGQGSPSDVIHHDMWEWDGEEWHELDIPLKPQSVIFGDMAFDEIRKKIVFFGGMTQMGVGVSSDTWEYYSMSSVVKNWNQY
ncbi:MAG: hypothetical protein JXR73_10790 [Candidatus Omnitrophica bacterium]|nr:hypothetical protein [Candidatus Omnitrophota bacterium]